MWGQTVSQRRHDVTIINGMAKQSRTTLAFMETSKFWALELGSVF
jgi:hypothetical protein